MLIYKGEKAYKCSKIKKKSTYAMQQIDFSILDCIQPAEAKEIFEDDTFYFYDDVLGGRLIETNNTKLVGLGITYNADSTCDITIKLRKRSYRR